MIMSRDASNSDANSGSVRSLPPVFTSNQVLEHPLRIHPDRVFVKRASRSGLDSGRPEARRSSYSARHLDSGPSNHQLSRALQAGAFVVTEIRLRPSRRAGASPSRHPGPSTC
jgi:hypothetical protein